MTATELGIRDLDFEATIQLADHPTMRLAGNADSAIVDSFAALITRLHGEVVARGAGTVTIDIRALEFMTASCFNVFVTWLGAITELPASERYGLSFEANPAIPWQRRSLRTLACFATDLVEIA